MMDRADVPARDNWPEMTAVQCEVVERWLAADVEATQEDIATLCNCSQSMVSQTLLKFGVFIGDESLRRMGAQVNRIDCAVLGAARAGKDPAFARLAYQRLGLLVERIDTTHHMDMADAELKQIEAEGGDTALLARMPELERLSAPAGAEVVDVRAAEAEQSQPVVGENVHRGARPPTSWGGAG